MTDWKDADPARKAELRASEAYDLMAATDVTLNGVTWAIIALADAIDRQTEVIDKLRKDIRK